MVNFFVVALLLIFLQYQDALFDCSVWQLKVCVIYLNLAFILIFALHSVSVTLGGQMDRCYYCNQHASLMCNLVNRIAILQSIPPPQASFYGQVGHSKLLSIKQRFQVVNFSPSGFIASECQRYNIDDLDDSTLHLATSAFIMKTRTNVCHGITAHTLWKSHGEHQVNTKSFRVLFTCRLRCHVHAASRFWGCGQFLPFIITRILGIKRIFPCSF